MREVTLGLIQIDPKLGDVDANIEKSCQMVRQAAKKGAQIVVLPETYVTGYDISIFDEFYDLAEPADLDKGKTVSALRAVAKEEGVYIAAGLAIQTAEKGICDNAIVFINDEGGIEGVYKKNHLFGPEKAIFRITNEFPVFKTKYGVIGILCCYDANFPEPARILTLKGAELILHAATWRVEDEDVWHLMLPVRAADNTVFFATANTYGQAPGRFTFGHCKVINPRGTVIAESGNAGEEILVTTIDLDQVAEWRKEMLYLPDINKTMYKQLDELIQNW